MQARITREIEIPDGGKLWDVEGVPVIELKDGSPVFANDLSRDFPSAKFRMFRSEVTPEDLKFWEDKYARFGILFVLDSSTPGSS